MKTLLLISLNFFFYSNANCQINTNKENTVFTKCIPIENNSQVKYSKELIDYGQYLVKNCENKIDEDKDILDDIEGYSNRYVLVTKGQLKNVFNSKEQLKKILIKAFTDKIPLNAPRGLSVDLYFNPKNGEITEIAFMADTRDLSTFLTFKILYSAEKDIINQLHFKTENYSIIKENNKFIRFSYTFPFSEIIHYEDSQEQYDGNGSSKIPASEKKCLPKTANINDEQIQKGANAKGANAAKKTVSIVGIKDNN